MEEHKLTENQRINVEKVSGAIDNTLGSMIESGVLGKDNASLKYNIGVSVATTGLNAAVTNGAIEPILTNTSSLSKGMYLKLKYTGAGTTVVIESMKLINGDESASHGTIAAAIGKEFLLNLTRLSKVRYLMSITPQGFIINVAIDALVVPAVGKLIDYALSDGALDISAPTFENPTDRYFYYYDAVENTSHAYTNTLPSGWTGLETHSKQEAFDIDGFLDNLSDNFPNTNPEKINLVEPTQSQEYINYSVSQANSLDNRIIVNALERISSASFLLADDIRMNPNDKLDLGEKGIYTVAGGEVFSVIAEDNNFLTSELLKLNTWLIDEGRVDFRDDKVLIKGGITLEDIDKINHTLTGDFNAPNILKDYNGGDDVLVGGSQADIMEGGSGFDTYIVNGGDIIDDSDAKGNIIFNAIDLTGTKTLLAGMDDMYEDDDFVYQERDGELIVTHKQGEGAITIKNWNSEKKEGFISTSSLDDSNTYFDITGDGLNLYKKNTPTNNPHYKNYKKVA